MEPVNYRLKITYGGLVRWAENNWEFLSHVRIHSVDIYRNMTSSDSLATRSRRKSGKQRNGASVTRTPFFLKRR